MKAVVTIVQCRRAVLPHIFLRYVLPRMRERFPGEIEAVLIQHRVDASGGNTKLESLHEGEDKLAVVKQWTDAGRYAGAEILAHQVRHAPYPSIPSYHRAVQAALDRKADFHLWLEDDALVDDLACGRWAALMGGAEVGVYRRFHHLNSAYLVTRPTFDRRIVNQLADYSSWHWRRRIEPFLRSQMRTRRVYFDPSYAVRYHHVYYPYTGLRYVVDAVRRIAPEAVSLLDTDFGAGCAELPPVTQEERAQHASREGARLIDRLWRFRQRAVERLMPTSLPVDESTSSRSSA